MDRQATSLSDLSLGETFNDHFTIEEKVGAGGMGEVYRLHHKLLKTYRALKVIRPQQELDPKDVERFLNEAKVLQSLRHPNIVQIHDFGVTGEGVPYQILEFIKGFSLSPEASGEQVAKLSYQQKLDLCIQVASALDHAHNHGVVHRDIKSSNILVQQQDDGSCTAFVIDFGIAKMTQHDGRTLTKTGEVIGSPAYISPEQAKGEKLDGRSDVYSFGIVMYELFTGQVPFKGDNPMVQIVARLTEPPAEEPLKAVPESLRNVILNCLALKPEDRYSDASKLHSQLEQVKTGGAVERPRPARKKVSPRQLALLATAAIGCCVLISTVIAPLPSSQKVERQEQQELQQRSLGHNHFSATHGTAADADQLSAKYYYEGHYEDALDWLRYGELKAKQTYDKDPKSYTNYSFFMQNRMFIGLCLAKLKKWPEAEPYLKSGWEYSREVLPRYRVPNPMALTNARQVFNEYITCLDALGKHDEAERVQQEATKLFKQDR